MVWMDFDQFHDYILFSAWTFNVSEWEGSADA